MYSTPERIQTPRGLHTQSLILKALPVREHYCVLYLTDEETQAYNLNPLYELSGNGGSLIQTFHGPDLVILGTM